MFSKSKDEVLETFRVVRGGRDVLDARTRALFDGVRVHEHGFEICRGHLEMSGQSRLSLRERASFRGAKSDI